MGAAMMMALPTNFATDAQFALSTSGALRLTLQARVRRCRLRATSGGVLHRSAQSRAARWC
jgi:hypothetical protein